MSNVINLGNGGGGGGGGIDFLTVGITQVGPDAGGEVFLIAGPGVTIVPTLNTLTISAQESIVYNVTTNDTTATPVVVIPVDNNSAVTVVATIAGASAAYTAACNGTVLIGARRGAGAATELPGIQVNQLTDSTGGAYIDAFLVGNNIEIIVRGEAATTWNWAATVNVVVQ